MEGVSSSTLLASSDSDSVVNPILLPTKSDIAIDRKDGIFIALDSKVEGAICNMKQVTAAESECLMGMIEVIPSTECEGSVAPALLPSADVDMFLLDGLHQVVEYSTMTASKVRFLHAES